MFRIPLFSPNEYLLLTPRWGDLHLAAQIGLLALLCSVPIGLIVWLYRYEMQVIKRRIASTLLVLRLMVLFFILMLVCLQPVYARDDTKRLEGRVIVAVDASESMGVRDPQREEIEKLQLARKLNLAPEHDALLADWIEQLKDSKEITWVGRDELLDEPARRESVRKERERIHAEVIEKVDQLTRSDLARHVLSPEGLNLIERIRAQHEVDLVRFALDRNKVTLDEDADWRKELFPEKKAGEKADRRFSSTDLNQPLLQALSHSQSTGGRILGVVVLSDGQDNLTRTLPNQSPVDQAIKMKERRLSIPLYPVVLGSRKPPSDIAVIKLDAPATVFQDVDVNVSVRFRVRNIDKQELKLTLFREGEEGEPLKERTIQHEGEDREHFESFRIRMKDAGTQMLRAKIEPQGENVKEADKRNNARSTVLTVAPDKAEVLLIDGEARWEFHYLQSALVRDPSMKVKSVVFVQPRLGSVPKEELEKLNYPALALPEVENEDEDPLFKYDCIILGDVSPAQLPLADRKRLEKYVADRGGTLVILAGKRSMPMAFRDDEAEPEEERDEESLDPLFRLMPIEKAREVETTEGFHLTLTPAGEQTNYLQLEPDARGTENIDRWGKFRKHHWGVIGKAKAGATTLAYVADKKIEEDMKPEERRDYERDRSVIAAHNYGFGQVLYLGVDSTWRWRYRIGDTYHHRFWGQTIRWAASNKPLVTGNKFLRFGTPKPLYRHDEQIEVRVRLEEILKNLPPDMEARARIFRRSEKEGEDGEQIAFLKLSKRPLQPRTLEGRVPDLPPGEYYIELDIPALGDEVLRPEKSEGGESKKLRATFAVATRDDGEMVELSTNYRLMKELALKNGTNKVYTAEDAEELIELLEAKSLSKPERSESKLWSWWPTLALVLLLLTIEWVLRKWAGLP